MEKLRQWNAAWQWLNPTQPGSQCACCPWWVVRWTVLMTHRIWCDPWLGVKKTSQSDHSQTDNHTPSTRTSTKCIPQHLVQVDSWPSSTHVFLLHQMLWPVTRKLRQNESIFPVQTALGGVFLTALSSCDCQCLLTPKKLPDSIWTPVLVIYPQSRTQEVPLLMWVNEIFKLQALFSS